MWRVGIVVTVVCGCSVSTVRIRDEQGRVRAVLDADGLALFDQEGRNRVRLCVAADGKSAILLRHGDGHLRLAATDGGWGLTAGRAGGEPTVTLLMPDEGQPYLKLGQIELGYERKPVRAVDLPPQLLEPPREMGLTLFDDEGCKRVHVGMEDGNWGLSVRDDTGQRRAELWTTNGHGQVVAYLFDEDGRDRVTLAAERDEGGWIRVGGAMDEERALMSRDKVSLRTARGDAELGTDGRGQAVLRVGSDRGAQVEIGTADATAPYVELRDAKGEVQRVPAK
jgi:hypothetical protein